MQIFYNKHRKLNSAIAMLLSFAGIWCLPYMLNIRGNGLAITNSYFSICIWGACSYAIYQSLAKRKKRDKKSFSAALLLAFSFSVCIAFGVQLDFVENVDFTSIVMWMSILVWTVILSIWIYYAWEWLESIHWKRFLCTKMENADHTSKKSVKEWMCEQKRKWDNLSERKRVVFTICIFILCWLPVFLAVYPGFFVYDAQDELVQVQTRNFTTHHPLPHVLLLGGIILGVNKITNSYNIGIAVYTLLQMLLMAGVFTYVLYDMKKRKMACGIRLITIIYYCFFPVIVMFTLCSAKDGIFTAALLLMLHLMIDMGRETKQFFESWKKPLAFLIATLVMMSFRHNGLYAFLVMVPILLWYVKGYRTKLTVLLLCMFLSYFAITSGLTLLLNAENSESQEMLTVPIQQLARTYKYDQESFTEEEKELLYEVIPEDMLQYYTPKVSDGIKASFNNKAYRQDPAKYVRLWANKGLQHPFSYLNAWFMTSYGFWYPDTVIDVYRGNSVFTFTYEDSSFFGYEVESPGTRESKMPWLNEWYRKMSLEITQQKVPVISMLFSPGFQFWIFAFTGGYAYYRKRYHLLLPFAMIMLLWLTVILGPTYLPRYVLILWFALPGAVAVLVNRE